jgi:acetyl esterase/lipase
MERHLDLEYAGAGNRALLLDLHLPDGAPRPYPLVLYIHGGAWREGTKAHPRALRFLSEGYAVASVEYRLSQEAIFPAQIHDCKAAVRWLRANAGDFGLDAGRIAAWGESAGAHLASLLGTSAGVAELEGDLVARANPITYVTAGTPPFLLMHGTRDRVVIPSQSELLHAAFESAGVSSSLVLLGGLGHGFPGDHGRWREIYGYVGAFLEAYLRLQPGA